MNIPYVWLDRMWTEADVISARENIEAAYNALRQFDDEWEDLPVSLRDALHDLGAMMRYYEQHDRATERKRLEEWQAWARSEVTAGQSVSMKDYTTATTA